MPQALVPGVARCALSGTYGGSVWANVHHIQRVKQDGSGLDTTAWSQAEIDDLAKLMGDLWLANFAPVQTNGTVLSEVVCQDLTNVLGVTGINTTDHSGSVVSPYLAPINVAVCIGWKEALHYRGGHLRTYLCPPRQQEVASASHWSQVYVDLVQAAAVGFLADLNADDTVTANGVQKVGVHRISRGAQLAEPIVTPVITAKVDARIDSMRRRLGPDIP